MTNPKTISISSLVASASLAILAFGLGTSQAHAQATFGISIGTQSYGPSYAPPPRYVYQQGYWQPDPDGDGNVRWIPGRWVVASYDDGYYSRGYYGGYQEPNRRRYYERQDHDHREHREHHHDDDDR